MKLQVGDYAVCDKYPTLFGTVTRVTNLEYFIKIDQPLLRGADKLQWGGVEECHGNNWILVTPRDDMSQTITDNAAYYHAITGEI